MSEAGHDGSAASARAGDIEALAAREGALWATSWFDALRRDGRRVAGGWPGTLTEARARIAAQARGLDLTAEEIGAAAKAAYLAARKTWAAHAEPDDEAERPREKKR